MPALLISEPDKSAKLSRRKLKGLVAATVTPMTESEEIDLGRVAPQINHLLDIGVEGLFACGSTGEGISLTTSERIEVAEATVEAASGRAPVAIHVGHNSVKDAQHLASHAESLGVDAIATIAPGFFLSDSIPSFVGFLARIAEAAPETPFYYYHFPSRMPTGICFEAILEAAVEAIPSFAGVKYTHNDLDELARCRKRYGDRLHFLFGRDELFLSSLDYGFNDFVGSTYNYAAPLFVKLRQAFQQNNRAEAERLQALVGYLLEAIVGLPAFTGGKVLMRVSGFDCGKPRCPLPDITPEMEAWAKPRLAKILEAAVG